MTKLNVIRRDAKNWMLAGDLYYNGESETFCIPAGYITDFASVPAFMRAIIDDTGTWTLAAVVHDWLITDVVPLKEITSRDADGIFRRIMREEETPFLTRWTMWAAVRCAALANPRRAYGRGFMRDLPKILAISPVALLLVPYVAVTLLTRGFLKLLHF